MIRAQAKAPANALPPLEDVDVSMATEEYLQHALKYAEALRAKVLRELSCRQISIFAILGAQTWQFGIGDFLTHKGMHRLAVVAQEIRALLLENSKMVVTHLRVYPAADDCLKFHRSCVGASSYFDERMHASGLRTCEAKALGLSRLNLHCLRTIHLSCADHPCHGQLFLGQGARMSIRPCALGNSFVEWLDTTEQFPESIIDVRLHFGACKLQAKQVLRWIKAIRDQAQVKHFEFRTCFEELDGASLEGSPDDQWKLIHAATRMIPHACVVFPIGRIAASLLEWIDLHASLPDNVLMTAPAHERHHFFMCKLQSMQPDEALDNLVNVFGCLDLAFHQEIDHWKHCDYTGSRPRMSAERLFLNTFGAGREDRRFSELEAQNAWSTLQPSKRRRFEHVACAVDKLLDDLEADACSYNVCDSESDKDSQMN